MSESLRTDSTSLRVLAHALCDESHRCLAAGLPLEAYGHSCLACDLSDTLEDLALSAKALDCKGECLRRMRKFPDAIATHQRALEAAYRCGDRIRQARVGCRLALSYARQGHRDVALATLQRALETLALLGIPDHGLWRMRRVLRALEAVPAPRA